MKALQNLFQLFYPNLCAVCDEYLVENESVVCTLCRHDLPLISINDYQNNFIIHKFFGRITIEKAFSLLIYRKKGITQKLMEELKFKGNENIGVFLGDWIGKILSENKEFNNVDCIIPVPIHKKREQERGYNQVSKFGKRLEYHLQKPFVEGDLLRVSSTKRQVLTGRFDRFSNVDTKFELKNKKNYDNKHILLIDDVVTTGATLEACAKEFLKAKNCKISILTMAAAE